MNVRIGKAFFEKCKTHKVFQDNFKLISPAYYILERIAHYNDMNDGKPSEMSCEIFKNAFKDYGTGYIKPLEALGELKLLVVNNYYHFDLEDPTKNVCKKYLITEEGLDLLNDSKTEYLKKMQDDKKVKRAVQIQACKRKKKLLENKADDIMVKHTHKLLAGINLDKNKQETIMNSTKNKLKLNSIKHNINSIEEKLYSETKYIESNGRLSNDYTSMPKVIKTEAVFNIAGVEMKRKVIVDVRSCHPTFFSTFLLTYFITHQSHTPLLGDEGNTIKLQDLEKEHKKWISLFCEKETDPKELIAFKLGKSKEYVKKAMIQTLNGWFTGYEDYLKFIRDEFPNLFQVWDLHPKKEDIGTQICKQYESVLLTDKNLYEYADGMGLTIGYENDGFAIISEKPSESLMRQVRFLIDYINFRSKQLWAIQPYWKIEYLKDDEK